MAQSDDHVERLIALWQRSGTATNRSLYAQISHPSPPPLHPATNDPLNPVPTHLGNPVRITHHRPFPDSRPDSTRPLPRPHPHPRSIQASPHSQDPPALTASRPSNESSLPGQPCTDSVHSAYCHRNPISRVNAPPLIYRASHRLAPPPSAARALAAHRRSPAQRLTATSAPGRNLPHPAAYPPAIHASPPAPKPRLNRPAAPQEFFGKNSYCAAARPISRRLTAPNRCLVQQPQRPIRHVLVRAQRPITTSSIVTGRPASDDSCAAITSATPARSSAAPIRLRPPLHQHP